MRKKCIRRMRISTFVVLSSVLCFVLWACATALSHKNKGDAYYQAKDFGSALMEYQAAQKQFAKDTSFLLQLARTQWKLNKIEQCNATLQQILQLNDHNLEALRLMAMVAGSVRDFPRQKELYSRILEIDPKDQVAHNNLALLLRKEGNYSQAIEHFNKAIALKNDYKQAYLNLGNLYAQSLDDQATAYYYYSRFLALAPRSPLAVSVKEWLTDYDLAHNGENLRAKSLSHFYQGEALLRQANFEKALIQYQVAVSLFKEDYRYFYKLGIVEKELGKYPLAEQHFKRALSLAPQQSEPRYLLGWVYKLSGDIEKARQQWNILLRQHPEYQKARRALEAIEGL